MNSPTQTTLPQFSYSKVTIPKPSQSHHKNKTSHHSPPPTNSRTHHTIRTSTHSNSSTSYTQKKLHQFAYTSSIKNAHVTPPPHSNIRHTRSPIPPHPNISLTSSLLQRTLLRDNHRPLQNHDHIGDPLLDKLDNTTRVYFININGIKSSTTGGDFNDICRVVQSADIDHFFAAEHNLDNTKYEFRKDLHSTVNKYFSYCKATISGSSIPANSTFKPGRVLSIAQNSYSGRIKSTTHDKMGRWIHHTLLGKNQRIINLITCYKVTLSSRPISQHKMTAYSQQYSQLKIQNPTITPDPRLSFDKDLHNLIHQCCHQNQEVLLMGDFNEDMEAQTSGLKNIMEKFQLIDIFHQHIGHSKFNTFQSGSARIDFTLATTNVAAAINNCGYEPLSRRLVSDHRGLFIDFDTTLLFGNATTILAPPVLRGFSSASGSGNREYINHKFDALPDDFVNLVSHLESLLIPYNQIAEKLDKMLTNSSLYAGMKCKKRKRPPLPKTILKIRDTYNFYRKCLSEFKLGKTILAPPSPNDTPWSAQKPTSIADCSSKLRHTKRALREAEKSLHISMDEQFNESLKEYIRTGNKKMENEIRNLRKARETKLLFSKLNNICKNVMKDSLQSIQVPTDKPDKPKDAKV